MSNIPKGVHDVACNKTVAFLDSRNPSKVACNCGTIEEEQEGIWTEECTCSTKKIGPGTIHSRNCELVTNPILPRYKCESGHCFVQDMEHWIHCPHAACNRGSFGKPVSQMTMEELQIGVNEGHRHILDGVHEDFMMEIGRVVRERGLLPHEAIDWIQQNRDKVREFDSGATRDTDEGKLDYEAFLSPQVLRRYAEYMHEHRKQSDGELRDGDNWQKGIPRDQYLKSAFRHFVDWWTYHRVEEEDQYLVEQALCALLFNVMGYLHEYLQDR